MEASNAMSETLDLRPWARKTITVTGASGRELRVTDWLPLAIVVEVEQLVGELREMNPETIRSDAADYETFVGRGHEIARRILAENGQDLTLDQLQEEMPDEAVFSFLGFLFRAWRERRLATSSRRPNQPAKAMAATPTLKPTSDPPRPTPLARTGSRSQRTSGSGRKAK